MTPSRTARPLRAVAPFVLAALFVVGACDSGSDTPTADELDGIWVNADAGTLRAFEMSATTRTYNLYVYADGAPPALQQSGTYSVDGGRLVTQVDSSVDAAIVGQAFANKILAFDGGSFTLETKNAPDGRRTYTRADALP